MMQTESFGEIIIKKNKSVNKKFLNSSAGYGIIWLNGRVQLWGPVRELTGGFGAAG